MPNSLKYEGVSWNCDVVVEQTEKQFVEENLNNQYREYKESDQRKLLKEAYRLIKSNYKNSKI